MASILMAYGVGLSGLGLLVQQIAPAFEKVTFITGIAGGGLCVLWGIIAFAGNKRRTWAVLTTIAVTIVLLTQVVQAWLGTSTSLTGRLVLTLMFLMTMGMLLYVLHGERPPEFYDPKAARRENPFSHGERPQSPDAGRRR